MPARRHLLAHLVRDIANRLPAVLGTPEQRLPFFETTKALDKLADAWTREVREPAPFAAEAEPTPASTVVLPSSLVTQVSRLIADHQRVTSSRRDEFALLMDALRPGSLALRPVLEPVIRDWVNLVRWFQGQAHVRAQPSAAPSEEELQRRFESFEYGLRGLLDGHFDVVREIDAVLDGPGTVEEKLARVKPLLAGAEQLRHFFQHLDDPAWLEPLANAKLFASPPGAVVRTTSAGTSTRWPAWFASEWLVTMASRPEAQAAVVALACGLPDTDNPWVRRNVADVALAVAPEHGERLVERLRTWVRESAPRAPREWSDVDERGLELAARLAEAGRSEPALALTRDVLRAEAAEVDPWRFRRILRVHVNAVVQGLGLQVLTVLRDALGVQIAAASRESGIEPGNWDDRSHVFCRDVEKDEWAANEIAELVRGLMRAASAWIRDDTSRWPAAVEHIENARWLVFRRITLGLLATEPSAPADLIAARLLDRALFDAFDRLREYRLLLHHGFGRLAAAEQERLLDWIDAGPPDAANVHERIERWLGREATDDDVLREGRRWRWRRLTLIARDLSPEQAPSFAGLAAEFGERAADDVIADPLGATRVGELGPAPPPKTPDDLLVALAKAVDAGDPSAMALALHDLKSDGVRRGRPLNWSDTPAVARRGIDALAPDARPLYDPRIALAELLQSALTTSVQRPVIPVEQRDLTWALIQPLAHSPDAEMRQRAVVLAVAYRSWVVHATMAGFREGEPRPDVSAPEVRAALDEVLDAAPTPEIHAALGQSFAELATFEHEWLRTRVPRLFPLDAAGEELRHAAWDAFLDRRGRFDFSGQPARYTFELLREVYEHEVEHMTLRPMSGRESLGGSEPERERAERVAEHVVWLCVDGTLERCGAAALVERLFANGDGRLREHALRRLGWLLAEPPRLASIPGAVERARDLWEQRRARAEQALAKQDERGPDELPGFGSWFLSGVFEDQWALEQLLFVSANARPQADADPEAWCPVDLGLMVVRRLGQLIERHPAQVMACFKALAHNVRSTVGLGAGPDEIRTILGAGLRSDDTAVRDDALAAFHRLGSLGFRAREIVPVSDDLDDPAAIAYFTWDHPMTVAEIRRRLTEGSEPERHRMLGQILREAKGDDVWKFTTPEEVRDLWPHVEKHLGRRREMWELLFKQWKEQGLLAG
jgi:hypothetical protein